MPVFSGSFAQNVHFREKPGIFFHFSLFFVFEGTLYQQKNKMIVLNTLLRKAIEPSKVHPYYIDAISSMVTGISFWNSGSWK